MTDVIPLRPLQANMTTLDELWKRAEQFGAVRIFSNHKALPYRYHCSIEFQTIAGTQLEAKSEFGLPLNEAILQAIDRAQTIAAQFKKG